MEGRGREILSRNLRQLRSRAKLTQEGLSGETGIDRSYISEIENGRFAASIDMLDRLAAAFDVEIWQLLHPSMPKKDLASFD